ncbi:hypothetical protein Tco_0325691, partial [Tanacetum coccineum]
CLPFELPEDVVNKTLQIILELQFFRLSLVDLYCHNSSKTFQQPFISAIKSYSFRLFSSLPGLVNPLAPRKGKFQGGLRTISTLLYMKLGELMDHPLFGKVSTI